VKPDEKIKTGGFHGSDNEEYCTWNVMFCGLADFPAFWRNVLPLGLLAA
jgi:hypothetical protein